MNDINIERLKKHAKRLLKAFRAGETKAVARVQAVFRDSSYITLMNAQHVIAREQGYDSWSQLRQEFKETAL